MRAIYLYKVDSLEPKLRNKVQRKSIIFLTQAKFHRVAKNHS
jgi:hypothetical protein